jgi:hypothetical protein
MARVEKRASPSGPENIMSVRAKIINSAVLATLVLVAWRFTRQPAEAPLAPSQPSAPHTATAASPPVESAGPAAAPEQTAATQTNRAESPLVESAAGPTALNERTLLGTKWERDRFAIEFGADGKLLIGGRERAQWRVEGSRVRLYRDTTGEEHWLDIVGNRLMWEGQEIGRVR